MPKQEQEKIVSKIQAVQDVIETLEAKFWSLQKIKQGLMQDLLTGKVRVKQTSFT